MFSTTEITSHEIASDNPIHQRLFFAYQAAGDIVSGDLLEIGCGVGRGLSILLDKSQTYTAIDKNEALIHQLQGQYPSHKFILQSIPPLSGLADNSFDYVVSFQVIEHIEQDGLFIQEIHRVLREGSKAIITTPNTKLSLTRNPWHVREYTADGLKQLVGKYFGHVIQKGVAGNQKVMEYHEQNRKSVQKWKRLDILNLEHRLPRWLLQVPYDFLNRYNRKKLLEQSNGLASQITANDYFLSDQAEGSLDLFYILTK